MALEYRFSGRTKPVKGETYPIKRGELDEALNQAGITEIERMAYVSGKRDDFDKILILSADMLGEASLVGQWFKRSPDLMVYTVPITVSQRIKMLISKTNALANLASWLKELETAENVRRDQYQHFHLYYEDDTLKVEKTN